jgi:hypothetical protein
LLNKKQTAIIENLIYPNIPSALRPVEHDGSLPVPKPHQQWALHEEEPTSTIPKDEPGPSCSSVNPDFPELTAPHLISQAELNYPVRDLIFRKFRRNSTFLVYRDGICYSQVLKSYTGNATNHCRHFF